MSLKDQIDSFILRMNILSCIEDDMNCSERFLGCQAPNMKCMYFRYSRNLEANDRTDAEPARHLLILEASFQSAPTLNRLAGLAARDG